MMLTMHGRAVYHRIDGKCALLYGGQLCGRARSNPRGRFKSYRPPRLAYVETGIDTCLVAAVAQMVERADRKSACCGFNSHPSQLSYASVAQWKSGDSKSP